MSAVRYAQEMDGDTSLSLMGKPSPHEAPLKKNTRTHKIICAIIITVLVVILLCLVIALVCLAEFAKPLRCSISDTFSLDLKECAPEHTLESLLSSGDDINLSVFTPLNTSYVNSSCEGEHCDVIQPTFSPLDLEYIATAEETWHVGWEILHDKKGWDLDSGSSLESGRVYSKSYSKIGRVSRLEGYLRGTIDQVLRLIVVENERIADWDPSATETRVLHQVTPSIDVYYMITRPLGGGLVSGKEHVMLRYTQRFSNYTMIAGVGITYPGTPPLADGIETGYTKPGGMMFTQIEKNKLYMNWSFGTDIGGWIPQWMIDNGLADTMMGFYNGLQEQLAILNSANQ